MTDEPRPDLLGPGDGDDRSWLSAYLDGELTDAERARVQARLDASPEWRAELAEVGAARAAVRSLGERELPTGFLAAAIAQVANAPMRDDVAEPRVVALPARRERRRVTAWVAGGVAAAALVGAMVLIPERRTVKPNLTAVVTQHGASSAASGDSISGLVPLAPMEAGR